MTNTAPNLANSRYARWRRWLRRAVVVVAAIIVLFAVVGNTWTWPWARLFIAVTNTDRTIDPADDPSESELQSGGIDRQFRVNINSPMASLAVWVIAPTPGITSEITRGADVAATQDAARNPRGTILLCHGINTDMRSLVSFARRLSKAGFRAVLVDLRGHGRSSGRWCTFGRQESRDLVQVVDALEREHLLAHPLSSWGQSLGGAIAIQHAAIDPRVRSVVALSTFSSYREVVPLYVRRALPGLGRLILPSTIDRSIDRAGAMAGFDPDDASPQLAVTQMSTPVLLMHGLADRNIPWRHSEAIRDAAPDHCEFILVPGAGHNTTLSEPHVEDVFRESVDWFSRGARPPSTAPGTSSPRHAGSP